MKDGIFRGWSMEVEISEVRFLFSFDFYINFCGLGISWIFMGIFFWGGRSIKAGFPEGGWCAKVEIFSIKILFSFAFSFSLLKF